ncbi:MAG: hypothetical protein KAH18_07830 [Psychromonas sp.]|nr:hypothetical protein [Psychromonas sp.]
MVLIAAQGITAINPSFDFTPARLIDAIVTEVGVVLLPSLATMNIIKGDQDEQNSINNR